MEKKPLGKGLKALIPEQGKYSDAVGQSKQEGAVNNPEIAGQPAPVPAENPQVSNNPAGSPPADINREPDPLFIENLKKDRERRVKAIEAMNELIEKYNE